VPKLVAEDIPLLFSLLSDVFPNVSYTRAEMAGLYLISLIILYSLTKYIFLHLCNSWQHLSAETLGGPLTGPSDLHVNFQGA
jgi:hypothetical protein